MLGLGRLFSDDTSIGHTAHDENTLKNMINIDLKYIQKWANKGNNKITELRTILQRESPNS